MVLTGAATAPPDRTGPRTAEQNRFSQGAQYKERVRLLETMLVEGDDN